jgi:hypothetical protein
MTMAEFATCLVPMDLASPAPARGFIMVCAAFYKRGFGAPPHQFFCSLLQSYGLELHHLSPSGILHMAIFVTLYEAYIGLEPPLNLWSHFFRVQLQQDSGVGAASVGSIDVSIRSGLEADSYFFFFFPLPDPPVGWWKAWFLLKNEADAPLPAFWGGRPIPHPDWEHGAT